MHTHEADSAATRPDEQPFDADPPTDLPTDLGADLTVAQLGEFALIRRLARLVNGGTRDLLQPEAAGSIGIGDDAALWTPRPGYREVLTTDALIENVHFRHSTTSWRDLGWKMVAENVSDIAAMGAIPNWVFVTLGVRPYTRVTDLEDLYRGMADLWLDLLERGLEFGPMRDDFPCVISFAVAGGDTVSSPVTMLSVTVVGELEGEGLRRAAGQPGDLLAVTGTLGGSAGGLALLEQGDAPLNNPDVAVLVGMHRRPQPRVVEGLHLARTGVRSGMDLSDGLLGDAGKLAYASDLSATLLPHLLPIPPALTRRFGEDTARQMALTGGEDYELLVAAQPETIAAANIALAQHGLMPLTIVGRLEAGPAGEVTVEDEYGVPLAPPRSSWDHFRQHNAPTDARQGTPEDAPDATSQDVAT